MIGEIINIEDIIVYDVNTFPYEKLLKWQFIENSNVYSNFLTFDIETTTFTKKQQKKKNGIVKEITVGDFSFMYVWQICINGDIVIGRTWEEFNCFLNKINEILHGKIIIYVHNLAYEFQFFRRFIQIDKIFARKERNPIIVNSRNFEFRCSYMLSNKSLKKFLETTHGVTIFKQNGEDFDYSVKRYPDTELTKKELWYCICDVLGLWQAISILLHDDTLVTIPKTSTGYVRRDFRTACLCDNLYKKLISNISLNSEVYLVCKRTARGAIAGSNAFWTNQILKNVDSYDIKSSYPYVMMTKYFPMSKFIKISDLSNFTWFIDNKCCMIEITFFGISLKEWKCIPYISRHKCWHEKACKWGNGKVYSAKEISMSVTEIDFKIIVSMYKFKYFTIHQMYVADKGLLPKVFRKQLRLYFEQKEILGLQKENPKIEYEYNKFKNKINSAYGMMLTDIVNDEIIYIDDWGTKSVKDIDSALSIYYKNKKTFLTYQWGVWVLAHARESLYRGMEIVKNNIVQCDTDSVKFLGDYSNEFEQINKKIMQEAETFDIKPYVTLPNGKNIYLGIWEHEPNREDNSNDKTYSTFKTLGAKKYCYADSNGMNVHVTVAGLRKNCGKWFDENGGIDLFANGTIVPPKISGRASAFYDDTKEIITKNIDGHIVTYSSNVSIVDTDYTFGVDDEWLEMKEEE